MFMEYRDWILMVKNNESAYLQQGPYSALEIENMLKKGIVRGADLAWSSGLDKWIPIQKISNVNWQIEKLFNNPEPQINRNDTEDILEGMEFLKQQYKEIKTVFDEDIPTEALPEVLPEIAEKRVIIPKSANFLFNFDRKLGFSIKRQKKPLVLGLMLLFLAIVLIFSLFLM